MTWTNFASTLAAGPNVPDVKGIDIESLEEVGRCLEDVPGHLGLAADPDEVDAVEAGGELVTLEGPGYHVDPEARVGEPLFGDRMDVLEQEDAQVVHHGGLPLGPGDDSRQRGGRGAIAVRVGR